MLLYVKFKYKKGYKALYLQDVTVPHDKRVFNPPPLSSTLLCPPLPYLQYFHPFLVDASGS